MGIQRLQFVHSYENSKAHLVLLECVKRQNIDTKVQEPLIIFEKDGKYKGIFRELFK
jgi:tRNA1(Val) A37 N6-methylase TrmN6